MSRFDYMISMRITCAASLLMIMLGAAQAQVQGSVQDLMKDDKQWPMAAKSYANTRFSSLDQINAGNVGNLKLAWTFSVGAPRAAAAMLRALSAIALLALLLAGCDDEGERAAPPDNGGDAERGAALIRHYGCGGCHIVPGISGANGLVGPPLTLMARRIYIAGVLRNSPDNMMTWLVSPQQVIPGNAMPDMGVSATDARDMTAYLYTLR